MSIVVDMTGSELLKRILKHDCFKVRQKGSHVRVSCTDGRCMTTVPVHRGKDLGRGLLRAIEKDLAPCLGEGWVAKDTK